MSSRPRPVTATVTKPRWMQTPSPDALRRIRRRSVESSSSTASLTSLLDHSSYNSASDEDLKTETDVPRIFSQDLDAESKIKRHTAGESNRKIPTYKSKHSDDRLSAWEKWIIEKAKEEHQRKLNELQEKEKERKKKEEAEREKRAKQVKANVVLKSWMEKKIEQQQLKKKTEQQKLKEAQREKEEEERKIKEKAAEKFAEWQEQKSKEEKERRQKLREEKRRLQEEEAHRKKLAEQKFEEWLKKAHKRPKSAPNSFGYLSGKMTGYHDRSAYPQPSFINPIPWQPPAVPASCKIEKSHKSKVTKPYKWNPDKYI